MSVPRNTTGQLKKRFLMAFELTGNIYGAAKAAEIARSTVYRWQEQDEQFVHDFRQAELASTERLELEAYRRAHDGVTVEKPIYDKSGQIVDTIIETKYSDTLLIFLLKARSPHKYRDNITPLPPGNNVSLAQARELVGVAQSDQDDADSVQA